MKDDIKNLREIAELVLEDIRVTDELKNRTLELCKKEKKSILKPFLAAASSAAIIALSLTGYQHFSHKVSSNLNDKQIAQNINSTNTVSNVNKVIDQNTEKITPKTTPEEITRKNTKEKDLTRVQQSNNNSVSSTLEDKSPSINNNPPSTLSAGTVSTPTADTTLPNKSSEDQIAMNSRSSVGVINDSLSKDSSAEKNANNIVTSTPAPSISAYPATLSTAEAEKYWGGKLLLPTYIPTSFELTDISIPKDNKELYVKLTYSSKNNYFRLTQNKSTKYNISGKSIDINGVNATIAENNDETKSNSVITQIVWVKDNVQYSIIGNIPDIELVNIAKSLN